MSKCKINDEEFSKIVLDSKSIAEVLRKCGLVYAGGNYSQFKRRVKRLNIDTSHFTGTAHLRGKSHNWSALVPLEKILTVDSYFCRTQLKKRLLRDGLINNSCYECGISTWNDKPLSLHIEHKNGINTDNRLENLSMLCPNCHSQTKTYAGRNKGRHTPHLSSKFEATITVATESIKTKIVNRCSDCVREISIRATRCKSCDGKLQPHKIEWLPVEQLIARLETVSYLALGRELGISDNAIRKYIKRNGMTPPAKQKNHNSLSKDE